MYHYSVGVCQNSGGCVGTSDCVSTKGMAVSVPKVCGCASIGVICACKVISL
jgi:hypothetical protein